MPKTLLVADDSLTIRKVIGMVFSTEDVRIVAVDNGIDAIARARELKPDLVLADVLMPGKSGYEVCESLKADPATSAMPVMLLAGTFEPFDEGRARAARADDVISKPFESQALLDKVKTLVGLPLTAPIQTRPMAAPAAPQQPFAPRPSAPMAAMPPAGARPSPTGGFATVPQPRTSAPGVPQPMPGPAGVPRWAPTPRAGTPVPPPARMTPTPQGGTPFQPSPGPLQPPRPAPVPMAAPRAPTGIPQQTASGFLRPQPPPAGSGFRPALPAPSTGFGIPRPPAPAAPSAGFVMPRAPSPPVGPLRTGIPSTPGPVFARPGVPAPPLTAGGFPRPPGTATPLPPMQPAAPQRPRDPFGFGAPPPPAQRVQVAESLPEPAGAEEISLDMGMMEPAPRADGGEAHLREALSKASQDVIERIAWEVVPQLAETILREIAERTLRERDAKA